MAEDELPAGPFGAWLDELRSAIAGTGEAAVPCGTCTACCEASQFVLVEPDERETLAAIPPELLFPAPRLPAGHVLLGYDEHGRCPMLTERGCSIYDRRPRACRTYDCRVFAAAGVDPAGDDPAAEGTAGHGRAAVAARARRWRFDHPSPDDRARHDAVRAAATRLRDGTPALPADLRPATATQAAVMAVEAHELFLDGAEPGVPALVAALRRRGS